MKNLQIIMRRIQHVGLWSAAALLLAGLSGCDRGVADGVTQPSAYPPLANNECIAMQPAADAIRTAFNCRYSP